MHVAIASETDVSSSGDESIFRVLSGVIVSPVAAFTLPSTIQYPSQPSGSIQAVAALITDLYITISLCVILRSAKTHTADGYVTPVSPRSLKRSEFR